MAAVAPAFALNHMCVPDLPVAAFFDLAKALSMNGVEIRNDIEGNAILDGTPPEAIRDAARERGLRILSINALQRFNEWNAAREAEAVDLTACAKACGAEALVLVPVNDGGGRANGERQANLRIALKGLRPILDDAGLVGLVEPLGFESCSLRRKSEAVETIVSLDAAGTFHLVHDTFHHYLAGEAEIYPEHTGLAHISGVADSAIAVRDMRDGHRVLVDEHDRLGNVAQMARLMAGGYGGAFSFEPFAVSVHRDGDIHASLARSMAILAEGLCREAA